MSLERPRPGVETNAERVVGRGGRARHRPPPAPASSPSSRWPIAASALLGIAGGGAAGAIDGSGSRRLATAHRHAAARRRVRPWHALGHRRAGRLDSRRPGASRAAASLRRRCSRRGDRSALAPEQPTRPRRVEACAPPSPATPRRDVAAGERRRGGSRAGRVHRRPPHSAATRSGAARGSPIPPAAPGQRPAGRSSVPLTCRHPTCPYWAISRQLIRLPHRQAAPAA